jgi:hypothetical protein
MAPLMTISDAIRENAKEKSIPRTVTMRTLPIGTMLVCSCQDCGLERTESAAQIAKSPQLKNADLEQLQELLHCERKGCAGLLEIQVQIAD